MSRPAFLPNGRLIGFPSVRDRLFRNDDELRAFFLSAEAQERRYDHADIVAIRSPGRAVSFLNNVLDVLTGGSRITTRPRGT